jgi:hypothetical protein
MGLLELLIIVLILLWLTGYVFVPIGGSLIHVLLLVVVVLVIVKLVQGQRL